MHIIADATSALDFNDCLTSSAIDNSLAQSASNVPQNMVEYSLLAQIPTDRPRYIIEATIRNSIYAKVNKWKSQQSELLRDEAECPQNFGGKWLQTGQRSKWHPSGGFIDRDLENVLTDTMDKSQGLQIKILWNTRLVSMRSLWRTPSFWIMRLIASPQSRSPIHPPQPHDPPFPPDRTQSYPKRAPSESPREQHRYRYTAKEQQRPSDRIQPED